VERKERRVEEEEELAELDEPAMQVADEPEDEAAGGQLGIEASSLAATESAAAAVASSGVTPPNSAATLPD
jgi:hypothetical protein